MTFVGWTTLLSPLMMRRHAKGKIPTCDILIKRGFTLVIGVACAGAMGKWLIICWCIVRSRMIYAIEYFNCLGFNGCYQGIANILFGRRNCFGGRSMINVWCGYCGLSKIIGVLKMQKDQGPYWNYCYVEPCLNGLVWGVLPIVILFKIRLDYEYSHKVPNTDSLRK